MYQNNYETGRSKNGKRNAERKDRTIRDRAGTGNQPTRCCNSRCIGINSKLNAKHDVSDSPMYQSLLRDREQWKRVAKDRQDQIEKNRQRYGELVAMYEDLERQLKESQDKNKTVKTDKNPFGAGRKRAYIEYAKQIEKLHKDGLSIRKISKELCIPSATIARYIKASYQNNYEKK